MATIRMPSSRPCSKSSVDSRRTRKKRRNSDRRLANKPLFKPKLLKVTQPNQFLFKLDYCLLEFTPDDLEVSNQIVKTSNEIVKYYKIS